MSRLQAELDLLRRHLGRRSPVRAGHKTIGGVTYTAVHIASLPISGRNFDVSSTDALLMLPPTYPALPPIGIYVNYRWKNVDGHFMQQSYYGSPDLRSQGWYWYCVGLGGGFSPDVWARTWRPAAQPENGHNLVTLVVAAQHAMRSEAA